MNPTFFLKHNLNKLPVGPRLGKIIGLIPYSLRPGLAKSYNRASMDINQYPTLDIEQRQNFIFNKINYLVNHAYQNTKFYKEFYDANKFHPSDLQEFADITKIPIINKSTLQSYPLRFRSVNNTKHLDKSNTGGSSGKPLAFYTSPEAIGHEWAHIHSFWKNIGYRPKNLMLGFGGRSNVKNLIEYDLIRNKYQIDIYAEFDEVKRHLLPVLKNYNIQFLHGYPSAIFEFAQYCEEDNGELLHLLKRNLIGAFLSSEYPHPHYRRPIETIFDIKTQSFYGHTERCVMAYEKEEQYLFHVAQTYGYAEVVDDYLIGTSYNSFGTPFIRYNTNDLIETVTMHDGILGSFKVTQGRDGDYVLDKKHKKISLTGLIFGRHHKIFDVIEHIQVYQDKPGYCTILYTTRLELDNLKAIKMFNTDNINMEFEFVKLDEPIKSSSGKVLLKVSRLPST